MQALELELLEWVGSENNRVDSVPRLLLDRLDVRIKGLLLLFFKFFERLLTLAHFEEFTSEW